jgi:hypothetical protein
MCGGEYKYECKSCQELFDDCAGCGKDLKKSSIICWGSAGHYCSDKCLVDNNMIRTRRLKALRG